MNRRDGGRAGNCTLCRLMAFCMLQLPCDQHVSAVELGSVQGMPAPESTSLKRWPLSFVLVATVMTASRASCAAEVTILKATESPSSAHCSTAGAKEAILDHPASAYAHLHCTCCLRHVQCHINPACASCEMIPIVRSGFHDGGKRSEEETKITGDNQVATALTLAGLQLWQHCSVCRWLQLGLCAPLCRPQLVPQQQAPADLCTPLVIITYPFSNFEQGLVSLAGIQALRKPPAPLMKWYNCRHLPWQQVFSHCTLSTEVLPGKRPVEAIHLCHSRCPCPGRLGPSQMPVHGARFGQCQKL